MHYNYYFELCSLVFLIVIAVGYYSRKKFPLPIFKLFGFCIGTVIVNVSLNVVASILLDTPGVPVGIHEFINEFYYFSQIILSYLLFAYVFFAIGKSYRYSPIYNLTGLPSIVLGLYVFINGVHHHFFSLVLDDATGLYNVIHGPAFFMIYVISGLNVFATLLYSIYFKNKFTKKGLFVLHSVVVLVSAGITIQFWFPHYLLSGLTYTISMMVALITINNPDEKVDRISKAFNNDAFVEYINNQRFELQRHYYIIFEIKSFGMFNKMFGHIPANELLSEVRKIVEGINKKAYIFKTRSARFVVLLRNKEEQIQMVNQMKEIFESTIKVEDKDVNISIQLVYFTNNNIFKNSDAYNSFLNRIREIIDFNETNYVELDEDFLKRLDREQRIIEILKNCLKNKTGLYMMYQPIYDVNKKCFNHFEALIRLASTELGYVGPAEFIPIAEYAGLANEIDNFVFEETCAFLARHPDVEILEINVSCAEFFNNPSERFINTIEKYKINPRRICLEITETVAVKYPGKTEEFMNDLGKYGVQFAMDDFGSGYSNVARFITLPFSIAKLDKSLLSQSERIEIFLDSAISLFKNLNIPIVIEGVETEKQLQLAENKGIDYIQGYYFSRPLEERQLVDFLNKNN